MRPTQVGHLLRALLEMFGSGREMSAFSGESPHLSVLEECLRQFIGSAPIVSQHCRPVIAPIVKHFFGYVRSKMYRVRKKLCFEWRPAFDNPRRISKLHRPPSPRDEVLARPFERSGMLRARRVRMRRSSIGVRTEVARSLSGGDNLLTSQGARRAVSRPVRLCCRTAASRGRSL